MEKNILDNQSFIQLWNVLKWIYSLKLFFVMQSKFSELENTLKHKKKYLMLKNTELKIILDVFLCSLLLKNHISLSA